MGLFFGVCFPTKVSSQSPRWHLKVSPLTVALFLVSINAWGKYVALWLLRASRCSPASCKLCPPVIWCRAGSVRWVYLSFFHTENRRLLLLLLKTTLVKVVRVNQNSRPARSVETSCEIWSKGKACKRPVRSEPTAASTYDSDVVVIKAENI